MIIKLPYGSKVAAERRFAYRTPAAERLVLDTARFLAGMEDGQFREAESEEQKSLPMTSLMQIKAILEFIHFSVVLGIKGLPADASQIINMFIGNPAVDQDRDEFVVCPLRCWFPSLTRAFFQPYHFVQSRSIDIRQP